LKEKDVAFERADSPERAAFVAKAYRPETDAVRDALTANDERTLQVYVYPEGAAASEVRLSVIGARFATGQGFAAFTSQRFHDGAAERALASELSARLRASVTEMPGEGDSPAR
ncbi:MAG: hypothetical protein K8I02_10230, partial [Candidatus Methylomirabilis sp.]|nr:hypothetical protein [Deltaproteobacteria bacterium]